MHTVVAYLLFAAGLAAAAPAPIAATATSASSALQTFTAPASIMPSEIATLINGGQSMLVANDGLLTATQAFFGDFDITDGTSDVDSSYLVPFALLPPQLVTSLLGDFELLISDGPEDLIQIITGALTFTPSVSKAKRQAPITGPIGNFLAQLIGYLPIDEGGL